MKIKLYDINYVGGTLLIPPVLLSEGFYIYASLALVIAVLLIRFESIFAALMNKTVSAIWFVIVTLSSGVISAAIGQYDPNMDWLFVVWTFFFLIYFVIILITIGIIDSEQTSK